MSTGPPLGAPYFTACEAGADNGALSLSTQCQARPGSPARMRLQPGWILLPCHHDISFGHFPSPTGIFSASLFCLALI